MGRYLIDMSMSLDMSLSSESESLRKLLGWHEPVPLGVVAAQFRQILLEPSCIPQYSPRLVRELSARLSQLSDSERAELAEYGYTRSWVPAEGGAFVTPMNAVFELPGRLCGFERVSPELLRREGVRDFLLCMGCAERSVPRLISIIVP